MDESTLHSWTSNIYLEFGVVQGMDRVNDDHGGDLGLNRLKFDALKGANAQV